MANKTKRVIHAGGIFPNPLLNREGAAAADTKPGTIGFFDGGEFKASVDGKESAILYVANMDYLRCKGVDDDLKAGDWVVAIQPLQGLFLNVRAAAGTYKKGQPVIVANGQITAATAAEGEVVFAYVEEDSALTAKAGELVRVVFK
ncbi:hypothetical protein GN208_12185 [Morganella sp. HSTU-ASny43]|uniref:hypothetical protein n=1 Tax=Morganella TaxID=581 RepID=UPI0013CAF464|nr:MULTISPECIES: hypothetical protein [Morganella]ELF0882901.1 hypothetical protein [Morganella morganii]MCJ1905845.1 hypothetical protein [Morganella sp. HSTU-ASny43]NGE95492.1 hypothetical protein [Morganella morganii]